MVALLHLMRHKRLYCRHIAPPVALTLLLLLLLLPCCQCCS
jgi:hypothetical protein